MTTSDRTEIETFENHLEELWDHLDTLFEDNSVADRWSRRHGPDWVLSDVPFHLGYMDRETVAEPIRLGSDLPDDQRVLLSTVAEIGAWNEARFAARPTSQTVETSLDQMRASRDLVRAAAADMTDADLDRPAWMTLGFGWKDGRFLLDFCRQHTWSEFMQLRIHMGREVPVPSSPVANAALKSYADLFGWVLDQEKARDAEFALVLEYTQPGVEPWTIRVDRGRFSVSDGADANADLVMTQSPESFVKTWNGIRDPAEGIQSSDIQISDLGALSRFAELFPPPK